MSDEKDSKDPPDADAPDGNSEQPEACAGRGRFYLEMSDAFYSLLALSWDNGLFESYRQFEEVHRKLGECARAPHQHLIAEANYIAGRLNPLDKKHASAYRAIAAAIELGGKLLACWEPAADEASTGEAVREESVNPKTAVN